MAVTRIEVFTDLISECEVGKKEYEWEFNCYYSLWTEYDEITTFLNFHNFFYLNIIWRK